MTETVNLAKHNLELTLRDNVLLILHDCESCGKKHIIGGVPFMMSTHFPEQIKDKQAHLMQVLASTTHIDIVNMAQTKRGGRDFAIASVMTSEEMEERFDKCDDPTLAMTKKLLTLLGNIGDMKNSIHEDLNYISNAVDTQDGEFDVKPNLDHLKNCGN